MAWQRQGYYVRSMRDGEHVGTAYLGRGPLADAAAAHDARARALRARRRDELLRLDALDQPVCDLCSGLDELVRAALCAHGFHQHARGQWRRKRHAPQTQA